MHDEYVLEKSATLFNSIKKAKETTSQKEIAKMLGLKESAFSNLFKQVLPQIIAKKEVENVITEINNLGKNIVRKFPEYISILENYLERKKNVKEEELIGKESNLNLWKNGIINSVSSSKPKLERENLIGIYDYYYHAISYPKLVKMPLLIKAGIDNNSIEVFLGNKSDKYKYAGIAFLLGSHAINFYLTDYFEDIQETKNVLLEMPFTHSPNILRGCYLCIGTHKKPSCGKVVLKKLKDSSKLEDFDKLESKSLEFTDESIDIEIRMYLQNRSQNLIKCMPIANPTFDLNDLTKELNNLK